MSKITKKRLCAILASFACVLAVLTSTILVVNAQVVNPSFLRYSVQGYTTFGYVVYDETDYSVSETLPPRLCEVNIPLTHSTFPDVYYDETTWDSQFYYSNYFDKEFDDVVNVASRIEYMQNSDSVIHQPKFSQGSVQWGDYYGPINTQIDSFYQVNKAMFNKTDVVLYNSNISGVPPISSYNMFHYSMRDIYLWDDDQFDTFGDESGIYEEASITQLLRVPFNQVNTSIVGAYPSPVPGSNIVIDYEDLVTVDSVSSAIMNVGTGEVFYDLCELVIRADTDSHQYLIYADINLPDEEQDEGVEHNLYKLLDFDAMILVNRPTGYGFDAFEFYVETQYHSILNIDEVERTLQRDSKVELPEFVDMGSWLAKGVAGFFNLPIVPGVTLGGILAVFVAFGVTMYLIKLFLGG